MMFRPPLQVIADEPNGIRIVRLLHLVLDDGPLGKNDNRSAYERLVSCGLDEDGGAKLATIKTSCAIFARAIYHWAGRPAKHPWVIGWPMFGGWLGDFSFRHPAWLPYAPGRKPEPGDLFYVEHPVNKNNNHVGFFVNNAGGDTWVTAEGGGGDGTVCKFTRRPVNAFFDHSRSLKGWWRASALTLGTPPGPKPEALEQPVPLARGAAPSTYVGIVQLVVGAKPDKIFGPKTEAALKAYQQANCLAPTGTLTAGQVRGMVSTWQTSKGLAPTGLVDDVTKRVWESHVASLR